jgi:hypothetical protein
VQVLLVGSAGGCLGPEWTLRSHICPRVMEKSVGRVEGKIALITGAARGQGRNHALRLAEQGADVIALDICVDLPRLSIRWGPRMSSTRLRRESRRRGRRVVSAKVDVRDAGRLDDVVSAAVSELGGLDIVSVNAGICTAGTPNRAWRTAGSTTASGSPPVGSCSGSRPQTPLGWTSARRGRWPCRTSRLQPRIR